ncbi:hypothetical protein F5Y16DRAFT_415719 [Xylariaceae sp. FL0255]|nr:hypothetical protein F5Y16DRAFT_415719 [Xylariaceae sp. FL0255]
MKAALKVIDYALIKARDKEEIRKMVSACQAPPNGTGIFLLDLGNDSAQQCLIDKQVIDTQMITYFEQSESVKQQDFRDGNYKGMIDTFEITLDDEVQGTHILPSALYECKTELSAIIATCDAITTDISAQLNPQGAKIASGTSDSSLKIGLQSSKIPAWEPTTPPHMDTGLLTLTFYDVASMEIAVPSDSKEQ